MDAAIAFVLSITLWLGRIDIGGGYKGEFSNGCGILVQEDDILAKKTY